MAFVFCGQVSQVINTTLTRIMRGNCVRLRTPNLLDGSVEAHYGWNETVRDAHAHSRPRITGNGRPAGDTSLKGDAHQSSEVWEIRLRNFVHYDEFIKHIITSFRGRIGNVELVSGARPLWWVSEWVEENYIERQRFIRECRFTKFIISSLRTDSLPAVKLKNGRLKL